MENVIRNVRDIEQADRQALEHLLGKRLCENQQLVIGIVNLDAADADEPAISHGATSGELPQWCEVYEGLSDEEIADLEKVILTRADLTRPSE